MKKVQVIKTSREDKGDQSPTARKVIKHNDLEKIFQAEKFKQDTEKQCAQLLEDTKNKCIELEAQLQKKYLDQFHDQQQALAQEIEKKLVAFFASWQRDSMSVLSAVATKLGTEIPDSAKLFHLIRDKLTTVMAERVQMVISANQKTLLFLRERVDEAFPETPYFTYSVKEELADDECMLETDYACTKINISQYFQVFSDIVTSFSHIAETYAPSQIE